MLFSVFLYFFFKGYWPDLSPLMSLVTAGDPPEEFLDFSVEFAALSGSDLLYRSSGSL